MDKEIIINTKYTFDDFILPVKSKILSSWGTWIVVFFAFLMLISDVLYLFDKSFFPDEKLPIINLIIPLLVFIIFPLLIHYSLKKNYENNYVIKEKNKTSYTKEGINTEGETHQSFTDWSRVKSIKEYKKFFVLKINGVETYLPKRFFDSNNLKDFKNLIQELGF